MEGLQPCAVAPLLAFEADLDLVLGLFLLRVMHLQGEQVRLQHEANAAVLLVREDRGALQSCTLRRGPR